MAGWFFILLHFFFLLLRASTPLGEAVQGTLIVGTLELCALSLVLSHEAMRSTRRRGCLTSVILGVPWLITAAAGSQVHPNYIFLLVCAYAGCLATGLVALRCLRHSAATVAGLSLVALGCAGWLTAVRHGDNADLPVMIVLTQSFLTVAILLTFAARRVSTGTVITSVGAFAWGGVWMAALAAHRFVPGWSLSPELWNVPKYLVASGMILTLLEDEICAAAQASEHYRLLFAGNPHPIWVYEPETYQVLEGNDAALAQYGYRGQDLKGLNLLEIFHNAAQAGLKEKLQGHGPRQLSGPWQQQRRDGSVLQADVANHLAVRDGQRTMFALMQDVTEREAMHARLIRLAHHDALTELPNRVLFEQRFNEALQEADQAGSPLALFCVDLDRFKQINDTQGHAAGDLLLQEVANRLRRRVGADGLVARNGGDEFMVLLRRMEGPHEAEQLASDLLQELRLPVKFGCHDLEVSCSVGFAVFPEDGREGDQLWRDADAAMYQAKRAGGSQWVRVSHEISSSASQANEIEVHLRRVLRAGELEVHYQPQFHPDGHFHSMEALFRSTDPTLRHLPTDRIIAIAEESALIVPLGNWVLEEVCRQARAWLDEGLSPTQIAVNVSPLQLTRFDFARQVARLLERYCLSSRMLEFEVTESTMMPERGGDAPHQIATLARMGLRFAVDDFGTGYSSLGRLHQLPVDVLKIDRSFTQKITEHNGTYPTVEAIIVLAHTFGMKVCAEGVETEEQLHLLRALRCDRVQGYLLSRPLTAAQATQLLHSLTARTETESVA